MVTLLDCIKRVPSVVNSILKNREETFKELFKTINTRLDQINEIVLIGSGTSNTASITARNFMEKSSGLRTSVFLPNEFVYDLTVRNPNALYLIISQTGTSIVVKDCLLFAKKQGFLTAAICAFRDVPIAQDAEVFIDLGCGHEEHPTRTIGYSATVFLLMMLGLEFGKKRGYLPDSQYDEFVKQASSLSEYLERVIDKALVWMDGSKRVMLRSSTIIFTGAGSLYGVALEGAVKIWEIPQMPSMGYELEEGIHGPNYGYNHNHCVIVLNDGGRENEKALALARYMKNEFKTGFVIGTNIVDGKDLGFEIFDSPFITLVFASAVQVLAYRLAYDSGRDLMAPHDNRVMYSYFASHSDYRTESRSNEK